MERNKTERRITTKMNEYKLAYIPDKQLYRAVSFALSMIRNGQNPGIAVLRAADYYKVDYSAVGKYCGQAGGRKSAERRKRAPS